MEGYLSHTESVLDSLIVVWVVLQVHVPDALFLSKVGTEELDHFSTPSPTKREHHDYPVHLSISCVGAVGFFTRKGSLRIEARSVGSKLRLIFLLSRTIRAGS